MTSIVRTRVVFIFLAVLFIGSMDLAPAIAQIAIFDSAGAKIGDVVGIQGQLPIVTFDLNGQLITLGVARDKFFGNAQLAFESTDCSGTRFLQDISIQPNAIIPVLLPPVAVASPGNTVYFPASNSSEFITVRSILLIDETCQTIPQPANIPAFMVQATINLDSQFIPPFSIQPTTLSGVQ